MSVIIANELVEFKNKVNENLSNMQTTLNDLSSKIDSLKSLCTATSSSISSTYNSSNKNTLLEKFSNINTVYDKVNASISNDMNDILIKSTKLLNNVNELENKAIELNNLYSKMNNKDDSNYSTYSSRYYSLKGEFDKLHSESLTILNELKGNDEKITFQEEFKVDNISDVSAYLAYGTFNQKVYTAKNGKKISYYLYVPDISDTTGLPMMVYLHGTDERKKGVKNTGLPKQIEERVVIPQGIVLCVQGTASFGLASEFNAIAELTESVANEYKVDKKRISACGHSDGAKGAYKMVANHTDLFSALIPISGCCYDEFPKKIANSDVKVWAFHGNNDNNVEYASGKSSVNTINKNGGDAELCTLNGGHCIQNSIFGTKYNYRGEEIDPLDWAFKQVKNS